MDIEKAKERQKKLAESIRKAEARLKKKDDTALTRKKILIGACVMSKEDYYLEFIKNPFFDGFLKRNSDRALFGLALISDEAAEPAPAMKNNF